MADFAADVSAWVERAKGHGDLVFKGIALEVLNRVKTRTPVDTGYLRANWSVATSKDLLPKVVTKEGETTDQPALDVALTAGIGDTIYVVNPVVYARRIEYGFVGQDKLGRNYNQKGRGMVQQTMAELPDIIQTVMTRYRLT